MQAECTFTTHQPHHFNAQTHESVCYLEAENRIFTLPKSSKRWDLPSGSLLDKEDAIEAALRILQDQTELNFERQHLSSFKKCYVHVSGINSIIYLFHVKLHQIPHHLAKATWLSIFAYRYFHLIQGNSVDLHAKPPEDGRLEAFNCIYHDHIWHPISISEFSSDIVHEVGTLILKKGEQEIVLNSNKRLFIPLLGIAASGKNTQSILLSKALGIPCTSARDQFKFLDRDMKNLIQVYGQIYPEQPLPDEVSIGMMAKRLSLPDCQAGITLRGFPYTQEQCEVFLRVFCQQPHIVVPLYLNIDDNTSRIPDQQMAGAGKRTRLVLDNRKIVFSLLNPEILNFSHTLSIAEVFHSIFQHLQIKLDDVAAEEQRLASSTKKEPIHHVDEHQLQNGETSSSPAPHVKIKQNDHAAPVLQQQVQKEEIPIPTPTSKTVHFNEKTPLIQQQQSSEDSGCCTIA